MVYNIPSNQYLTSVLCLMPVILSILIVSACSALSNRYFTIVFCFTGVTVHSNV